MVQSSNRSVVGYLTGSVNLLSMVPSRNKLQDNICYLVNKLLYLYYHCGIRNDLDGI